MKKLILSLSLLTFLSACEISGPSVKVEPPKINVNDRHSHHEHHDEGRKEGHHKKKHKKGDDDNEQ